MQRRLALNYGTSAHRKQRALRLCALLALLAATVAALWYDPYLRSRAVLFVHERRAMNCRLPSNLIAYDEDGMPRHRLHQTKNTKSTNREINFPSRALHPSHACALSD